MAVGQRASRTGRMAAMARIVRVKLGDGRDVSAIEVPFEIRREDWNEYELADGGRVRVKNVVHKILRVVDDDGKQVYDANGDPVMIARNNVVISASE
jgi:hypothetical protein